MPVRERVVLAKTHGKRIGGNLASIRAELDRRQPPIAVVTLAQGVSRGFGGSLRAAGDAVVAGYHLATARVFVVDSHFFPMYVIRPRSGTVRYQTWHATGAIKKIGYSLIDKPFGADESVMHAVRVHSNYTRCLASSKAAAEQFVEAFRQPIERFDTHIGIPRTDVLFDLDRAAALQRSIRERYRLPAGRRVILYAPTFRGDSLLDATYEQGLDFALLQRVLGEDHVVLARLHPAIRSPLLVDPTLDGFVIDVSDYPEFNELMLVADVLVTDYSSAVFEFALLKRPVAFFAPDRAAYERDRGLYLDLDTDLPAPVFETTEDLAAYLRAAQFDLDAVARFAATWIELADGHASQRFVDQLIIPALSRAAR